MSDKKTIEQLQKQINKELKPLKKVEYDLVGYVINAQNQVTELSLFQCEMEQIPECLCELIYLQKLYLVGNKIEKLPESFAQLQNLSYLDLYENQLKELPAWFGQLQNLSYLSLSNNQLKELPASFGQLQNLSYLDLYENQLKELPAWFGQLQNLSYLSLSNNQLKELPASFGQLQNLSYLSLSNNQLKELPASFGQLQNLSYLDLENNQLKELPASVGELKNSCQLYIGNNPLETPPLEIAEKGIEAIHNYFEQIEQQGGTEKLYEAKLIIVGEGGAGKTTLMEKLFNPDYKVPQPSDSTLGIEVREGWTFQLTDKPDIQFQTNIWDFGGQEIQYMTHQFFLTPSALYILVSDNREQKTRFPYWFKIIRLLGEEDNHYSPVIVALNDKQHQSISNFDLKTYEKHYPELAIQQCDIDLSKNDTRFQLLCETIQHALTQLRHVGNNVPKQWKPIREALRQLNKDYICFKDYQQICQQHGISEEQSQLNLSGYLHKLGSILHFQNDSHLHDFIILKPQWAVDAVYSVLTDKQVIDAQGCFSRKYLDGIWQQYNHNERNNLFNLMKADNFEICYPIDESHYIAPQLLPDIAPEYEDWQQTDNLNFRFQYNFMPEGILTRLIVRLHDLILKQDKQLVWRKGVVLASNGCQAQIIEDENNRDGLKVINIAVRGNPNERKYLLRKVREEIRAIHNKWFKNIEVDEMIPCHCDDCKHSELPHFYEFDLLRKYLDKGESTIKCEKDLKTVYVKSLLEGVFEQDELKQVKLDGHSEIHIHNHNENRIFNNSGEMKDSNTNLGDNAQLMQQFSNLTPEQQKQLLEQITTNFATTGSH